MTTFAPPDCPKCGAPSTAPIRASMGATPYRCTRCEHAFDWLAIPSASVEAPPSRKGIVAMVASLRQARPTHSITIGKTEDGMSQPK